ncbi:DNA alkylation repair protein [Paenibacillus rigui]|uniref:DNA alkylation repair protein n=1 Tax=Paenibacillus rigui TaxID=554312 RepID=A0A229UJE4_9BACL|nr:DNA alkylation repair protein [Paenibacillus rigui]OXM83425.1 DNA alkylation repair protein [Paenibacillus rigui]
MERTIREQLQERAEGAYRQFAAALIPKIDNIIGVRLPELRRMAKQIARGDWRTYLEEAEADYFEEVMLQGMVIGYAKADADELLQYIAAFVPKINNWSVCDSFCSGLKFTKTDKQKVWSFIQPYLNATDEYAIRFGVVMLLNYYIEEEYIDAVFERFNQIKHEGYYVKMAVAWAISICFVKLPSPTRAYLTHNVLDDVTYNKALQKITESNRVDQRTKTWIRSLKRKG